jgi:predicted Rossmann fold nucleotide-binding protein DprA/Smf involved in DNA uptake
VTSSSVNLLNSKYEKILLLSTLNFRGDYRGITDELVKPLTHTEYIGLAKWLHEHEMRPSSLLEGKLRENLHSYVGIGLDRLSKLLARGVSISFARERWERAGIWIISRADSNYPTRWRKRLKNRAPALLFGAGNYKALDMGGLGIVGSRNISDAVESFVIELAEKAARNNINIISGGARGVDSIAMQTATNAQGKSLGILADSLLKAIVRRDSRTGIENGSLTLVTPFSPEAGFNAGNAMSRNKLIYASSDFVVVAQTDKGKGGTWAGATECLNNRWAPVLVQSRHPSEGLEALISKGAQSMDIPDSESFIDYFQGFETNTSAKPTQGSLI